MKNKKTLIVALLFFFLVIAVLAYNYVFYSEHRNIANEEATVSVSAGELHTQFLNNESLATTNYLDKVVETSGKVTSVENNSVTLNNRLDVIFNDTASKPIKGDLITVKGRCVGYDDLLEVVKIDQAIIIN